MADYIVWQPGYTLGHEGIDEQHKRIIGIINDVFSLVKKGGTRENFEYILNELKQYTQDHFSYEERLMTFLEYPRLKEHAQAHRKMAIQTAELCDKRQGDPAMIIPDNVLLLLKDWWVNHIRGLDVQYAPYLGKLEPRK